VLSVRAFILKRLAFVLPQLLVAAVGAFLLLRVLPVDPVAHIAGQFASPNTYSVVRHQLGLDRSLGTQLSHYLGGIWKLDFGRSWSSGDKVRTEIVNRAPVTLQLIILGFALALLIAVPLGWASAVRPGGRAARATGVYALFAGAQPDFWWGLVFSFIFFFKLGWFPAPLGLLDPGVEPPNGPTHFILIDTLVAGKFSLFASALEHFALPAVTLAFVLTGAILKIMRQSALDVLSSEYLLYAKAAGLPAKTIRRMAIRNAFAPVLTVTGILFGFSLGGAVMIETIFSLDGLGRYALTSTLNIDYPAIQGSVVVMTAFALGIYFVMDLLYALLDPRIRYATVT